MLTKPRLGVLILSLASALGVGVWWWQTQRQTVPSDRLVLYGNVDIRQVDLAFNGSERITEMLLQEGARVVQGQLLAKLAPARLAAKVAQVEAEEARLALAREELEDASLYAPSAGIIRNRILEPGDMASPQKPVYWRVSCRGV